MKLAVIGIIIAIGMVGAFLYAQPFLALRSLSAALAEGDSEAIKDHIDFENVRQSLKDEFLARLNLSGAGADDNSMGALGVALISKGVEGMLDGILTPQNLARREAGSVDIYNSGYDTTSRFHASMERGSGDPITLVLRRQGTTWRVTAMKPSELAWREFELYRRKLTAEVGDNLKTIFAKLSDRHDRLTAEDPKVIRIPRTPPQPPCGKPYTWTEEDIAAWKAIGFAPSGPVNYSYSVATGPDVGLNDGVTMMVAEAVSDLDCNGKTSYFSLAMGENPEGRLYRAPAIYAENELE